MLHRADVCFIHIVSDGTGSDNDFIQYCFKGDDWKRRRICMWEYRFCYRDEGLPGNDTFFDNTDRSILGFCRRLLRMGKQKENSSGTVFAYGISAKLNGSFTVEAAIIIPTILLVIAAFINIAMYCHDKAALFYLGQRACLISVYEEGDENIIGKAEEEFASEAKKELMGKWDIKTEVSIDEGCVCLMSYADSVVGNVTVKAKAYLHQCCIFD